MPAHVSRRSLLQAAAVAPAALALPAVAGPARASAASTGAAYGRVDADSPRFTLAVLPDTQYLFDHDAADPRPLAETFHYLLKQRKDDNIVFMTHLGDVTEHGTQDEISLAASTFDAGLADQMPYSVLGGNHDVSGDDQRGTTPYLQAFGPSRFAVMPTFGGASPDGYNSYHVLTAAGQEWLVLALDWRTSDKGVAWVQGVIDAHHDLPVILTTHDLVAPAGDGGAALSDNGERLWEALVRKNDQVFLMLNGHYWPPARTVLHNDAGNEVHAHITNYQDRYYGGAGMVRLYHFDLARGVIDVETFSPWFLDRDPAKRSPLAAETVELTSDVDRFTLGIDFAQRFKGFSPLALPAPRPASAVLPRGTLAYWRFDAAGYSGAGIAGAAVAAGTRIKDLSGNGNDLVSRSIGSGAPSALPGSIAGHVKTVTASAENAPNEVAVNLRDADSGTKWLAFDTKGWVQYALDAPVAVVAYALTSANDAPGRDPRDWVLQGSNDGSTWVDLDERSGQRFASRFQMAQYAVAKPTAYSSYRLTVTANNGDPLLQLADLQLSSDLKGPLPAGSELLTWSDDHMPGSPAQASLRFNGSGTRGAILESVQGARINSEKFLSGFTIEAFVKLPDPFVGSHDWMGILSWEGNNGRTSGYTPDEPPCSLNLSPERFLQFVLYPELDVDNNPTHWSHALPTGVWQHVAVVNDGTHSVVYVNGSRISRNPTARARGIETLGKPFVIGGTQSNEQFGQGFHGWVGDVRVCIRALQPKEFLTPTFLIPEFPTPGTSA
ncbi:3',5'-cyclic AMP phosphodiesterase CpdA [Motilibacter peucedani]|uniref:3',5'-cyclic AMP phosphodiesterase CpdA n=1 Tax=Motilibacter peucedani TaxID=598650 RepID=A0A420XT69_9ACTN|nr:LamG-like jellyroll fold domain-containing protein [Motilibacter peucedani]RKS79951.1 3',5'-cyclic AMP phosphodiesterase CpdA [Motilibacter peucedani]